MSSPRPGQSCDQRGWRGAEVSLSTRQSECNDDLPVQIGANLVGLASSEGVALSTTGLEEGSTLSGVTYTSRGVSTIRCRDAMDDELDRKRDAPAE